MLSTIRDKLHGRYTQFFLLAFIAIPFVFWGINDFESDARVVVASVDGTDIPERLYRSQLEARRRAVQQSLAPGMDAAIFDTPAFKRSIIDGLVNQELLIKAGQAEGHRISDALLGEAVRGDRRFHRDGQFDPGLYDIVLRNADLTPQRYEKQLRASAIARQMESAFSMSPIVTNAELAAFARLESQQRQVTSATVSPSRFLSTVTVSAAEVGQYYDAHQDSYRVPERVRLAYAMLAADALTADSAVGEADLRAAYEAEAERFGTPERRTASHILIEAKRGDAAAEKAALESATAIRKKLLAGADFAAVARESSADSGSAAAGGDLGEIRPGAMVAEFEAAVKALKAGEISEPVQTQFGYHIIKLTSLVPAKRQPFESVRPAILAELKKKRAEERFYQLVEQFNNLTYEQADSLKPAAEALALRIQETDWVTRESGSGIAENAKIRTAAFDPDVLEQGRNSNPIEVAPGTLIAVRVIAHEPSSVRSLESVRADVEKSVRAEKARMRSKQVADGILAAARGGESLASAARAQGFVAAPSRTIGRRDPQMDPRAVAAVFRAARPVNGQRVLDSAELGDGGIVVFEVERVIDADGNAVSASQGQAARQRLLRQRGDAYFENYVEGLRQRAEIKVFEDKL